MGGSYFGSRVKWERMGDTVLLEPWKSDTCETVTSKMGEGGRGRKELTGSEAVRQGASRVMGE